MTEPTELRPPPEHENVRWHWLKVGLDGDLFPARWASDRGWFTNVGYRASWLCRPPWSMWQSGVRYVAPCDPNAATRITDNPGDLQEMKAKWQADINEGEKSRSQLVQCRLGIEVRDAHIESLRKVLAEKDARITELTAKVNRLEAALRQGEEALTFILWEGPKKAGDARQAICEALAKGDDK